MSGPGQHVIPRYHLSKFSDQNGCVWIYNAGSKPRSSVPERIGVENNFYSFPKEDGTLDNRVDELITHVEGRGHPIYDKLLTSGAALSPQDKLDFGYYVALMYVRTTAVRRQVGETLGKLVQTHMHAFVALPQAFESLVKDVEDERGETMPPHVREAVKKHFTDFSDRTMNVAKHATLPIMGSIVPITQHLRQMNWAILESRHGFFITSDNPVSLWSKPETHHPIFGHGGFQNKTVEVSLPLSPKKLLLMTYQPVDFHCEIPRSLVTVLNDRLAANSESALYSHVEHKDVQKLAEQYKDSRPSVASSGFGPKKFAKVKVVRKLTNERKGTK